MSRLLLVTAALLVIGPPTWRGALAVALFVLAVAYIGACAFWPDAPCRRCGGSGRLRAPDGRHARRCPRCKGHPWRTRWGRRAFDALLGSRKV
jgi:hypothetical protein